MENKIIKFIFVFVGSTIVGIGISIFLSVGQGVDAWTLLLTGIMKLFNENVGILVGIQLKFGTMNQLFGIFAVLLGWIIERKRPKFATIINFLTVGFVIDFFTPKINLKTDNLLVDIVLIVIATIITGFGVGIYITAKMGEGPVDIIMMIVINQTNTQKTLGRTRMLVDLTAMIIGIFLGGKFGWATIITVLGMGYAVQYMINIMNKYVWIETKYQKSKI